MGLRGRPPATAGVGDTDLGDLTVFETTADIAAALGRVRDSYDPRTTSVLAVPRDGGGVSEPFHARFLDELDERRELERLLDLLPEKERTLLILWFTIGKPVAHIARQLRISRVHCYRLKAKAFETMLSTMREDATTVSEA